MCRIPAKLVMAETAKTQAYLTNLLCHIADEKELTLGQYEKAPQNPAWL